MKTAQKNNDSLQKRVILSLLRLKKGIFEDWLRLAEDHNHSLNLTDNFSEWQEKFYDLIAVVDERIYLDNLNKASSSLSRLTYKDLNHRLGTGNYFTDVLSIENISLILRARTEILNLNFIPYREDRSGSCDLCNLNEREDILHFLGACPILQEVRRLYFEKSMLTRDECLGILNGDKSWKMLSDYCRHAFYYRNSFM